MRTLFVAKSLTDRVLKQFSSSQDDPERLICPELERQRLELKEYHRRLAEAGSKGGKSTQARARSSSTVASQASSDASSHAKAPEMRCDEVKRDELKSDESLENGNWPEEHKDWGKDYDSAGL